MSPAPILESRGFFQMVVPTSKAAQRMKTIGVHGYPQVRYGRGNCGALMRNRSTAPAESA